MTPDWRPEIKRRLRPLGLTADREADITEELAQHLDDRYHEARSSGVTDAEARRQALEELSGNTLHTEAVSRTAPQTPADSRPTPSTSKAHVLHDLWQDLRFGARMLIRQSAFSLIAIVTLAIGIGANTATFSLINAVLLSPLPYPDADRLVVVATTMRRETAEVRSTSFPDFRDWRANPAFELIAARSTRSFTLTGSAAPERINGEMVSADYFPVLKVAAATGRTFLPEEDTTPDTHPVAVISESLWRRRFAARPDAIGQALEINNTKLTIVGIMPPAFHGISDQAEIWMPIMMLSVARERTTLDERSQRWLSVIARLKPGFTLEQAQVQMNALMARTEAAYPDSNRNRGALVVSLQNQLFGGLSLTLWTLFGAVACVLLVTCANVANLQLQRASGRSSEMAVRLALGATPQRLIRQLLTESVLLALIGGVLGVALAFWSITPLLELSPVTFPSFVKFNIDARVLGFSLLVALVTGVLFGLAPALQIARPSLSLSLKAGGRNLSGALGRNRLLGLMVVSETALALTLLIAGGLMLRTLQHQQAVDPGFNADNVLMMSVSLPSQRYRIEQTTAFADHLRGQLASLPGVQAVAIGSDVPLNGDTSAGPIDIDGRSPASPDEENRMFRHRVSPGFFDTLGIPLRKGRDFNQTDTAQSPGVVIVSAELARRYWPGEDPLGKRIREAGDGNQWFSIVGVVEDIKFRALPRNPNSDPDVYFPAAQRPYRDLNVLLRTTFNPDTQIRVVRSAFQSVDPLLPIYGVRTLQSRVDNQIRQSRFSAWLLGVFGVLALILASVGVYSVMAYAVQQRRREIGVRVALGARAVDVLNLILRDGMRLVLIGIGLGVGLSLILTQLMKQLLFGVSASDPWTYVILTTFLSLIALIACWIPARRATTVDPIVALRCE